MNFFFLEEYLRKYDIKILRAVDGAEAVRMCKANNNIDLVLMDIKLPVMSGFDATV